MTVKLLGPWGSFPVNALYTSDAATEAAMIANKVATSDLTNGVVWPVAAPPSGPAPVLLSSSSASTVFLSDGTTALGLARSYTWEARPATAPVGVLAFFTDIGPSGAYFIWDGTYWRPHGRICLLRQLTTITKTDANTSSQTAVSLTIPGGLLSPGTRLVHRSYMQTNAVVAVNKTLTTTLGAASTGTYTINTTTDGTRIDHDIQAVSTSQVRTWWPAGGSVFGPVTSANSLTSVDLTVDQTFLMVIAWATAGSGTNTLSFHPTTLWLDP